MEIRQARLERLGYASYREYLRSPEWLGVRRRYRQSSDLPQDCVLCGDENTLLHHRTYERVGEERATDLVPLCPGCHGDVHALVARGDIELGEVEVLRSLEQAKAYQAEVEDRGELFSALDSEIGEVRQEDIARQKTRQRIGRLREAEIKARRQHVDVTEELDLVERAIASMEGKLRDQ